MSPVSILRASRAHWFAQEAEASTMLELYLNNPVGVPSHPDLMKEINDAVCKLACARENIKTIEDLLAQVEGQLKKPAQSQGS